MKEIQLTQGKVALVDDEEFEFLNEFKWQAHKHRDTNESYYAITNVKLGVNKWKSIKMHRLIMKVVDPKILVDHRDRNGLNNQKINLRTATRLDNAANRNSKPNTTSKFLGVSWHIARNKWRANIQKNKKIKHLGYFINEIEAAKAYNNAAILTHGEFANLNHLG